MLNANARDSLKVPPIREAGDSFGSVLAGLFKKVCVCARQTSAYPLFLPRQDSRRVDDADALQDRIGHLGTHEPG